MNPSLESLASCWQGLIPATFYTCSRDGIPNAAYLSHVEYVDRTHVALSFQFFNKSRRNVAENPHALVRVIDPDTCRSWALRLRLVRSETSGPVFERMDLRIEAIASYTGLKGIFKLLAADIYEVQAIEPVADDVAGTFARHVSQRDAGADDPRFTMRAMQDLSVRIHQAASLDVLLDSILAGLDEIFGFRHSMILVPAEDPGVLVTIASRGYPENGVGAEARVGEGIIGVVAEARKPIRISGLLRAMLYAHAVAERARETGLRSPGRIPLPGLSSPESQLGVPLLVRGELVGVLCIESDEPYRFHEEDKASIELLGSYLAIAIQNMQWQEQAEGVVESVAAPAAVPAAPAPPAVARHKVTYHATDEIITVDGEYLIRSLPARILWKLLTEREREGRAEFTNRELRLDKSLHLPEWKDNLESRLLLLRRRLEQKCPDIRLVPRARGRFGLELKGEVALTTKP
jgi:adenylate cyclase